MLIKSRKKKYQYCTWHIKLWRQIRYRPQVLFDTIRFWKRTGLSFRYARRLALGEFDISIKYLYRVVYDHHENLIMEDEFYDQIKSAMRRPGSSDEFRYILLLGMKWFRLSDVDVADLVSVTTPTVRRWKNGNSCPVPEMRKPLYRILIRKLEDERI